jgi:hypothetical protein
MGQYVVGALRSLASHATTQGVEAKNEAFAAKHPQLSAIARSAQGLPPRESESDRQLAELHRQKEIYQRHLLQSQIDDLRKRVPTQKQEVIELDE